MPAIEVADMRTYRYVIDFEDVTIFFLYKGRISGIFSAVLQKIYNTWQPIYANDVFTCFKQRRSPALWPHFLSREYRQDRERRRATPYRPVSEFLNAPKLKRCRNTAFFVHIPKTAGATIWDGNRKPCTCQALLRKL